MQKTTHSHDEWFFLPAEQSHERSERPTLKRRHDGDDVGSGGGGVYCEAGSVEQEYKRSASTKSVNFIFLSLYLFGIPEQEVQAV